MDHEAQVFGQGLNFFHIENLLFSPTLIEGVLRLSGLYWRGRRNAAKLRLRRNEIVSHRVPKAFDGFQILHLSDLHTDMSQQAMTRLLDLLPSLEYELCVLTGDYRGKNFGPFNQWPAGMARLREALNEPLYGVLGDHDTIRMVPDLEAMGIRMLLNECVVIERGGHLIHLAGIDDAHFYRVDDIEKAADAIPHEDFSILLSHTPEIYRQAAAANDYPAGVQRTWCPDRIRRFVARTCPYVRGDPPTYCGQRLRAMRQGTVIASCADGVPGLAQALLGAAFLGSRLLLHHER